MSDEAYAGVRPRRSSLWGRATIRIEQLIDTKVGWSRSPIPRRWSISEIVSGEDKLAISDRAGIRAGAKRQTQKTNAKKKSGVAFPIDEPWGYFNFEA
jgi:hypothetical protein